MGKGKSPGYEVADWRDGYHYGFSDSSQPRPQGFSLKKWVGREKHWKKWSKWLAFITCYLCHFIYVNQNQTRVIETEILSFWTTESNAEKFSAAVKFANEKTLGVRTLFPPHPFFKGKALGTRLDSSDPRALGSTTEAGSQDPIRERPSNNNRLSRLWHLRIRWGLGQENPPHYNFSNTKECLQSIFSIDKKII